MSIPVSVIVVTKNEENRIENCLKALSDFEDIWVVDSESADQTQALAAKAGAQVINFKWDGSYPKKRQWCLDTLPLKHDFVFFVDADEIVTQALVREMRGLDFAAPGYFVKGRYIFDGKALRFGLCNNKLALMDRTRMMFPVIEDLDLPGMGEIEGHYQPVLKEAAHGSEIGQLKAALLHDAYDDKAAWQARHERYAAWERGMKACRLKPKDPRVVKRLFKALPFQAWLAFAHSYILKLGFLDGAAGYKFARSRRDYYKMIG